MRPETEKNIFGLVQGGISLLKVTLSGFRKGSVPKKGDKDQLLILGNGPSLLETLEKRSEIVQNSDYLAVNHISRSPLYTELKPRVLVIIPIEFWDHEQDEFLKEEFYKTATPIVENTDWDIEIIAPSSARKFTYGMDYLRQNKHVSIRFVQMTPIDGNQGIANWIMRNNLGLPRPHNVLIPSLVLGVNMGYKKIFVAGADHSWTPFVRVTDKNEVVIVQKHFYDAKTAKEKAMYNANTKSFNRKLHEVLQKFVHAFKSYFIINDYAKSKGVKIVNITPDSFIDAFDRG